MSYKGQLAEEVKDLFGVDVANKHLRDNELKKLNPLVSIPGSIQPYQGIPTMTVVPFWKNINSLLISNILRSIVARPNSVSLAMANLLMATGLGIWSYYNGMWAFRTYTSIQSLGSSADFILEVLNPSFKNFSGSPLNVYPNYLEHVRAKANKLS